MKLCTSCETTYADHHTTCGNESCEAQGARLVALRQLEPGAVIRDKYRIVRFLGKGGMGTVYLAWHILLKEQHALKFISDHLTDNPRVLARFQQEAQAVRRLRDANVVEVYDLDQVDDGSFYIAMKFVPGPGLEKVLLAGPLSVERSIAIARGVANGLAAAHANGIIHRDIKPANILLDHSEFESKGVEIPKLLDFGIAAVKESSVVLSRTHGLMLTPDYAAPEQWDCMLVDQMDGRTDLYALGGILYEMLTGRTCFQSQSYPGWMDQHLRAERTAPSCLRPEIANWPGLDTLVLSLLAIDRDKRPANAAAVIEQLGKLECRPPSNSWRRGDTIVEPPLTIGDFGPPFAQQTAVQARVTSEAGTVPGPMPLQGTIQNIENDRKSGASRKTARIAGVAILAVATLLAVGMRIANRQTRLPDPSKAPSTQTPVPVKTDTIPVSEAPSEALPNPSAPSKLLVTCNRSCAWALDGKSQGSLLPGSSGEATLPGKNLTMHLVTAESGAPVVKQESGLLVIPGRLYRQDFVFAGGKPPVKLRSSPEPKHAEVDALIESGYTKHLDDDLPGAYTSYSNAQSLSMGTDKYRLQDATTGKKNVLADCRDRGISCFAKQ